MPLPEGTRYRVKATKSGGKVRLAFSRDTNEVLEAKKLPTKNGVADAGDKKREGKSGLA